MTSVRRVLIADDHAPTRVGVRLALQAGGFEVCGEVATGADAVSVALAERPDICLLDIRMPGGGIAAAGAISSKLPDTAVVMLTVSRDDEDLFAALRAGACGYLLKEISTEELPRQLDRVLTGEAALSGALVARVIEEFRDARTRRPTLRGRPRGATLTAREWEVLELLHEGRSTREVAERLFVTPGTVRSHVTAILRKLRVESRDEAVRLLTDR